MARCGCNSACACSVVAGDNVQVGGNGTPTNPYTISAERTEVDVQDSGTVDMTRTGSGTEADPYIISSEVVFSADDDNCAVPGTDGGVYVPCPTPGANAPVTEGPGANVSGGTGPGDPYVVEVDTGCGLEIGPAQEVQVATAGEWGTGLLDFPCNDDMGAPIYCDAAGELRTIPERFEVQSEDFGNSGPGFVVTVDGNNPAHNTPNGLESPYVVDATVTNPSTCRSMDLVISINSAFGYRFNGGFLRSRKQIRWEDNGAPATSFLQETYNGTVPANDVQTFNMTAIVLRTIPPGGTYTIRAFNRLQVDEGTVDWASDRTQINLQGWNN